MNNYTKQLQNLTWTGERYLPSIQGPIELEHIHRYIIATQYVLGKRVLDIASGEGYGSNRLSEFAEYVIGVDIDNDAIAHAKLKYQRPNLDFRLGSASAIPVITNSIDVVISFETIEHHDQHEKMLLEIKRVLKPDGLLIISSPNKYYYSIEPNYSNPHHVKELFTEELEHLLNSCFKNVQILGQRTTYCSVVATQNLDTSLFSTLTEESEIKGLSRPTYDLAFASDLELPSINNTIFEMPSNSLETQLLRKDTDWGKRLENSANDFRSEISRIAAERDAMFLQKDTDWGKRLEDSANDMELILPKVSVITVNFNGKKFLAGLINSLLQQNLPPSEIIVVDNASTDDSVDFLERNFPFVRVVRSDFNRGFAGGNNLGVQEAKYPLVTLINNDTIVTSSWLKHLVFTWVKRTAGGEKIGAVSPKIRFLKKFITLRFTSITSPPTTEDGRILGVAIDFARTRILNVNYTKPIAVSGFHGEEHWAGDRIVHWTSGDAELMLPVDDIDSQGSIILRIAGRSSNIPDGIELTVHCSGEFLGSCLLKDEFSEIDMEIPVCLLTTADWVINNAGSRCDRLGNVKDIGINQQDHGQYDKAGYIDAFCGCSVLMSRSLFLRLKGFDESFFMYYEDADLSWRINSIGYKIIFEPRSVVKHIHAGSSIEWSPKFRYFVTRNYRLNGIKNAALPQMSYLLVHLIYAFFRRLINNGINMKFLFKNEPFESLSNNQIEIKALGDAILKLPRILLNRIKTFL
jgi:GT2 family glycosyltransferase/2-polyprenyl-3-methyl-5-hydroxy-6-metoxy-1,4-benzoquinol methylase